MGGIAIVMTYEKDERDRVEKWLREEVVGVCDAMQARVAVGVTRV